jgi:two-component system OmpR family response regulator
VAKHILVVEDDADMRAVVQQSLTRGGFRVTALSSGAKVPSVLAAGGIDLAVVDLGLPDTDGLALTQQIRSTYHVGVIILSGRGDTTDRIVGLEVGADDYLPKPFEPRELLARVRSVLRRLEERSGKEPVEAREPTYAFNGWKLDCSAMSLFGPDAEAVPLTTGEFKLLQALVERANRVLKRDKLLDLVSSNDAAAFDRSIDVRVGRLRRKLGDDSKNPQLIKTVRNGGYIFVAKVDRL